MARILKKIMKNWQEYLPSKCFVVKDTMVTITYDSTKWVSPYNTSYWYTNITIDANAWIDWVEWAIYEFECNSSWAVSNNRNARIRIWTTWSWIPFMAAWNTILSAHSYLIKDQTRIFVFKTVHQSWWALHMNADTTYSTTTVAAITAWTSTSAKVVSAQILNQWIKAVAVDNTAYDNSWDWVTDVAPSKNAVYDKISAMDTTISWKADSSAVPTKVSDLDNDAGYTSNTGTITSVKMNGSTVSSSWEADLWTVITAHQNLKTINNQSIAWTGNISVGTLTAETVASWDSWTSYTIKVSTSAPASWTASNIITFVK